MDRRKEAINLGDPSIIKAHMTHYINHGFMHDCIECFGKVELEKNDLPARSMALMNVVVGPCKAILDGSSLEEAILVAVHQL